MSAPVTTLLAIVANRSIQKKLNLAIQTEIGARINGQRGEDIFISSFQTEFDRKTLMHFC